MDLDTGNKISRKIVIATRGTTAWTKNQDTAYINGAQGGFTKGTLKMICEKGLDNCLRKANADTGAIGGKG
mgnify:CR=1 FL=1|jgi:hypothetical protein